MNLSFQTILKFCNVGPGITLRRLNTVFVHNLANAIQRVHKDCIKQT